METELRQMADLAQSILENQNKVAEKGKYRDAFFKTLSETMEIIRGYLPWILDENRLPLFGGRLRQVTYSLPVDMTSYTVYVDGIEKQCSRVYGYIAFLQTPHNKVRVIVKKPSITNIIVNEEEFVELGVFEFKECGRGKIIELFHQFLTIVREWELNPPTELHIFTNPKKL